MKGLGLWKALAFVSMLPMAAYAGPTSYYIEAGGTKPLSTDGKTWTADKYFTGGQVVNRGAVAIANSTADVIYQTERYGVSFYRFPIENGTYTVDLHFAETFTGTKNAGQRVFDVIVENKPLYGIDVFQEAGGLNKALVKTVSDVTVNDGRLDIEFIKASGATMVNAIAISPSSSAVKVDGACGAADDVETPTKPTTGLCSAGTASAVTGTGPWNWRCVGSKGGTTASCSAPKGTPPAKGVRGRVRVSNGTVVSDKGSMLRGTSAGAIRTTPARSSDPAFWSFMRNNAKLNLIRVGVKTKQAGRTVNQQLAYMDRAVELAAENNMYIMFNNSIESGHYDLADLRAFWTVVAPRYKDKTHVIYELTNEIVSGGPSWGCAHQYTDKVKADMTSIWQLIRSKAPNTHIAWVDAANLCDTVAGGKYQDGAFAAMLSSLKGINWANSSVAFHSYTGTYNFGEAKIANLKRKFPLIMTETNYWNSDVRDRPYQRQILRWYERQKVSWVSLDNQGNHLVNEIIPDLKAAGFTWTKD